jgi:hypothetical protein
MKTKQRMAHLPSSAFEILVRARFVLLVTAIMHDYLRPLAAQEPVGERCDRHNAAA